MSQSSALPATILVIIGITGNLAKRRLLPAIQKIAQAGQLPSQFTVVGITRQAIEIDSLLQKLGPAENFTDLESHLQLFQMDLTKLAEYQRLNEYLTSLEKQFAQPTQRLFYLSIPPQISGNIIEALGQSGLAQHAQTKLLLEKPFGTDFASAEELVQTTNRHFSEEQIYRIDHYLAKEMAQNILVFRNGNSLFKRTWNRDFIEKITITAIEKIGIEGRSVFYEQTGALRDLVQSHLLQLAALVLMDIPKNVDWAHVSTQRLQALHQLHLPSQDQFYHAVKRGQYQGYKEEVGQAKSSVETFVQLQLVSDDFRWQNVPITLVTGKALDKKCTEIRIFYRRETAEEANQLVFRIQPEEGILVQLWSKKPGYDHQIEQVRLKFAYEENYNHLVDAYEQVIIDSMRSDHRLFTSSEEVLAAWEILSPIQHQWALQADDLIIYPPGSSVENVVG